MRSRPNSSGQGESDSSHSTCERIELTAVAVELLALGGDDVLGRLGDEALVREHALGALDLRAQPLDLGVRVAVRLRAVRLDDSLEDPLLVPVELRAHPGAAEDLGGRLDRLES